MAGDTREARGRGEGLAPHLRSKKEKRKTKGKKDCHQGQNVTVLAILERLEFKYFFCRPAMVVNIILFSVTWPLP